MKPISFAFGAATKIETHHGGKIRARTKVEENENETKSTERQGNARTKDREKLKINEPNAPLQKPDFSSEAKPKTVSVDPHFKGDRSVQRPLKSTDDSVEAPSVQFTNAGPKDADEFTQRLESKLNAVATPVEISAALVDPLTARTPRISVQANELVESPPICIMPIRSNGETSDQVALETSQAPPICMMPIRTNGATTDDASAFADYAYNFGPAHDLVDPKLSNWNPGPAHDLVDPKLVQQFLAFPSHDLVDWNSIKLPSNSSGADLAGVKSSDSIALASGQPVIATAQGAPGLGVANPLQLASNWAGPAHDLVDPKLIATMQNMGPAHDLVDPKLIASMQNIGPAHDLVDPKQSAWNPGPAHDLVDPKLIQSMQFGPAHDLVDPKLSTWNPGPAHDLVDPKSVQAAVPNTLADARNTTIKSPISNALAQEVTDFPAQDLVDWTSIKLNGPKSQSNPAPASDLASSPIAPVNSFAANVANAMAVVSASTFSGAILESANALIDDLATDEIDVKTDKQESAPVAGFDQATSRTQKADGKSADPRPLTRSEVSNVLDQIADRLESLAASKPRNGVTIHLKPFDLGSITMMIKGSGKSIEAEIQVSHESVRQALEQTQKHLSANLEARGYSLANITISDSSAMNSQTTYSDAQSQLANQNGQSANGSRSTTNFATPNGVADTTQRNAYTAKTDGVDYWI